MKFKVKKNSKTFSKFEQLFLTDKKVRSAALKLAKELGGINFATNGDNRSGGISAIEFKEPPDPKLWSKAGERWQKLFYPKAKNKQAREKIASLPIITNEEANAIIGIELPQTVSHPRGIGWVNNYAVQKSKGNILVEVDPGCKFKPSSDLIEIKESEFQKLAKRK